MDDYIKREDAIDAFCSLADALKSAKGKQQFTLEEIEIRGKISGVYLCKGIIRTTKSADVAPVRHGKWIEYGENKDGTHNMRCSKCGAGLKSKGHANSYYTKHKYRYCQNCGAKMYKENDND